MPVLSVTLCCQKCYRVLLTNYLKTLVSGQEKKPPKCPWFCPGRCHWKHQFTRDLFLLHPSHSTENFACWPRSELSFQLPANAVQPHPRDLFTRKTWKIVGRGTVLCQDEICRHICGLTVILHWEHCVIRCHVSKDSNTYREYFFFFPLWMCIFS